MFARMIERYRSWRWHRNYRYYQRCQSRAYDATATALRAKLKVFPELVQDWEIGFYDEMARMHAR
jgi:hypothetical protein